MNVGKLISELQNYVEMWPDLAGMPITIDGASFDLVIPYNSKGLGPLTRPEDLVAGIDLCDSGLT